MHDLLNGGAFRWLDFRWPCGPNRSRAWVSSFLPAADPVDFVTYHNYGVGEPTDSNQTLFTRLDDVEKNARFMRQSVDAAYPGRHVPIFLSE